MSRFCLWVASAAFVAIGVVGCAHCDVCDDLPTPCYGPNCAYGPGVSGPNPAGPGPMPASSVNSAAPGAGNPAQNPATMPVGPAPNMTPEPSGSADPAPPTGPTPPVGLGRP